MKKLKLLKRLIDNRHEVITRQTEFDQDEAKKRAHILEGLIIACDNIDEVIRLIKTFKTPNDAIQGLMAHFGLDDIQVKVIVDMRLCQLTGLMQDQLHNEYNEIMVRIEEL